MIVFDNIQNFTKKRNKIIVIKHLQKDIEKDLKNSRIVNIIENNTDIYLSLFQI